MSIYLCCSNRTMSKEYYNALEKFDEELELSSLIDFLKAQLVKTWEEQLSKEKSAKS